jgi:NAD-dependent SIR2 family protein deacetylase
MDKARPSLGYLFLAYILTQTNHKYILTTNFDTMTEDALRDVNAIKPLVVGHESLAARIDHNDTCRPVIIKLHGDYLLWPQNDPESTKILPEKLLEKISEIVKNQHL